MKRLYSLLLIVVLVITLVGCSNKNRLSGSYTCFYRYEFIITENGRGDYGGKCNKYAGSESYGSYSWYVEDNIVYINGDATFGYSPELNYIYELDSYLDVTLHENMTCTANEKIYAGEILDYIKPGETGKYEIVDNILAIVWDGHLPIIRNYGLVVDGKVYSSYGAPV